MGKFLIGQETHKFIQDLQTLAFKLEQFLIAQKLNMKKKQMLVLLSFS